MITTTHARPHLQTTVRPPSHSRAVLCPNCCMTVGLALAARERQQLLAGHRCPKPAASQPATAVPFS